jgi:protein TonB
MFEDSIFESAGRIHTSSHEWMVATFAFNASILLAFVMIPLICPPMLPHQFSPFFMQAFVPPKPQLPQQQPTQTARPATVTLNNPFAAPRTIPQIIVIPAVPDPPVIFNSDLVSIIADPSNNPIRASVSRPIVHTAVNTRLRVSNGTEEGLLLEKKMPVYPPIASAAGISGTVTLAAIISKIGTIENLRVTGGPMMLQQAALDAVKSWRYRPYLLDGQPVEVETTVSVIFTLQR